MTAAETKDMTKLRVALIRNNFLPYSETFIYDTIQHYHSFDPIVFAKKRINADFFPFAPVITPKSLKTNFARKLEHILFSSGIQTPGILGQFQKHKPEIIHAHFGQSGLLAIPYAKKLKIPLIVSVHGNDVGILLGRQRFKPKWWFYALSFKKLIAHTTLFLAASSELKQRLLELGCPEHKVKVHRLGIDLEQFKKVQKKAAAEDTTFIFMIGRLVEKKGFGYGIKALAKLLEEQDKQLPDIKLCIVGDGPMEKSLRRQVSRLGLSRHVEFLGRCSHKQVSEYLRTRASLLLCPSVIDRNQDRDSGLIVAKEAAASGIPVIGSLHGGIPDIIEDQITGFLVPERDIAALTQAVKKLVFNPGLRQKLGSAARQKMETEYDIRRQMAELESIYKLTIQRFNSTDVSI